MNGNNLSVEEKNRIQLQLKDVAKGREWHRMEEIVTEIGHREVEDAVDLFRNVIESVIRCKAPLHVIVCLYDYVQSCMDLARPALNENDRDYLLAYKIWGLQKNMAHNNSSTVTGSVMHDAMAKSEVDVINMLLSIVSDSILLVQDVDGQVPLHILVRRVFMSPPDHHDDLLEIIGHVLMKKPEASIICDRNLYEENPLVLALKSESYCDFGFNAFFNEDAAEKQRRILESITLKVVSLILRFYPKAASYVSPRGYTPLHSSVYHGRSPLIIREIFSHFKEGSLIRNGLGEVALHFAAMRFDDCEIFRTLLDCTQSTRCKDAKGLTPLHWLFIRYLTKIAIPQPRNVDHQIEFTNIRFIPRSYVELVKSLEMDFNVFTQKMGFSGFWDRMAMVLKAGAADEIHGSEDKRQMLSNRYLLHASCSMLGPLCIPRLIYNCDRDSIQRRDSTGRLPLHYACTRSDNEWSAPFIHFQGNAQITSSIVINENAIDLVKFLISRFPLGVRTSDKNNRLPLHKVLDSVNLNSSIVDTLVEVFPGSVSMRDGVTYLYPFMLAVASKPSDSPSDDDITLRDLEICFKLLKIDPDLVNRQKNEALMKHRRKQKRQKI